MPWPILASSTIIFKSGSVTRWYCKPQSAENESCNKYRRILA